MCNLPKFHDDNILVGLETSDDAAVYKINEETAIIQTLDFFTPIVDDPYTFGQIAAANSLSDVYAMGGKPILALNIVGFPNCLDTNILSEILRGGAEKVAEAGAVLVGGHSIVDEEPKYGLSVTGIIHPDKILANAGAKAGDVLILTKPIGLGILNSAVKAGLLDEDECKNIASIMTTLNKTAAEGLLGLEVNACTDITGFGLGGHAYEMAKGSDVSIELDTSIIPLINGAVEHAKMGIVPGGTYRNKEYIEEHIGIDENVPEHMIDLVFDPQTSGGLLVSLSPTEAEQLKEFYHENLTTDFAVIGRVLERQEKTILIK